MSAYCRALDLDAGDDQVIGKLVDLRPGDSSFRLGLAARLRNSSGSKSGNTFNWDSRRILAVSTRVDRTSMIADLALFLPSPKGNPFTTSTVAALSLRDPFVPSLRLEVALDRVYPSLLVRRSG